MGHAAQHQPRAHAAPPEHNPGHLQGFQEARRKWWLVVEPDKEVDLCSVDPGFDVDLFLSTDLRTMTEIWMGYLTVARVKERQRLVVTGDRQLEAAIGNWLKLSPFAKIDKLVA